MKPHQDFRRKTSFTKKVKRLIVWSFAMLLLSHAGAAWLQDHFSKKLLAAFQEESAGHGVSLRLNSFRSSGFASFKTLRWKGISGQADLELRGFFTRKRTLSFELKKMDISVTSLFPPLLEVRGEGLKVIPENVIGSHEEEERLEQGVFQFSLQCPFWDQRKARRKAARLFHQGLELLRNGKTRRVLDFRAVVFFKIKGAAFHAAVESVHNRQWTSLKMPVQDLITISAVLDEALTSHEIRLLSEHPLYASELLKIRNYARSTAYYAAKQDPQVPKDAYRHVLWSYLLTRAFGEKFSEQVTQAHEINPALKNTPEQTKMDAINNAVGRRYARAGYAESSLLKRLMNDKAVIRYSTDLVKRN